MQTFCAVCLVVALGVSGAWAQSAGGANSGGSQTGTDQNTSAGGGSRNGDHGN